MTLMRTLRRSFVKPLLLRKNRLHARFHRRAASRLAKARHPMLSRTTFAAIAASCGKSTTVFPGAFLSTLGKCRVEIDLHPRPGGYALLGRDASTRFYLAEVHASRPGMLAKLRVRGVHDGG